MIGSRDRLTRGNRMREHLFVYTSTSMIAPAYLHRELASIVDKAVQKNRSLEVTGALLYSEAGRFAQALEGSPQAIESIVAALRKDTRHRNMVTIYDGPITSRRFARWDMGWPGHWVAIDRAIQAAEYEANLPSGRALTGLLDMMEHQLLAA
ncbi:MAG: BLUF domain-containing protein [Verrucomicrobiaceae bacterium]|nr:MAG: BLUF domain-containing protein [Verrucomicrobiaceae bacterium]